MKCKWSFKHKEDTLPYLLHIARPSVSRRARVWFSLEGWCTHNIQMPLVSDCTVEPRGKRVQKDKNVTHCKSNSPDCPGVALGELVCR